MFQNLEQFLDKSDLTMVISKNGDLISISVLPKLKSDKDEENLLRPITITGTAQQIDEGFIQALQQPMEKLNVLTVNAKVFEESVEEVVEEKEKAEKKKTEKSKTSKTVDKKAEPKKQEVKVKEKTATELSKEAVKEGDDAMAKKDYDKAVIAYARAVELMPDDKKVKDKYLAAERWKKSIDAMYADDKPTPKEVIAASNPNQASLLDHPNVMVMKPNTNAIGTDEGSKEDQEEPNFDTDVHSQAEGPLEGKEDNGEELEVNF